MDAQKMIAELERDEGMRLKPYPDSMGVLTIGVGRNLRDVGITKGEAYQMLHNDIDRVTQELDEHLPWWSTLSEVRQRVLVNMCFNLGYARLLGFRSALAAMQIGDWEGAASGMMASQWANQVGPRAVRLAAMMRTGQEA